MLCIYLLVGVDWFRKFVVLLFGWFNVVLNYVMLLFGYVGDVFIKLLYNVYIFV